MIALRKNGYDVLVNVTNLCDARCVMCNIWKNQDMGSSHLSPELLKTLHPLSTVSLAGGEPFLHREVVDMVRAIHANNPHAKVIFTSNGFRTDTIVEKVREMLTFHRNLQVTISLDGIGDVHDRIRGTPGAWEKVNRTFNRLGEIGLRKRNFAFTITADNYASLPDVYAHARKQGAGLSLAVAQSSKFLNVKIPKIDHDKVYPFLAPVVEDHLKSWKPWNWARAFFLYGLLRYLATGLRPIACDAFDHQFMVDQTGAVFSCHPLMLKAGELSRCPLKDILNSAEAHRHRPGIHSCHACWEVCTARSGIRTNWLKVGLWAAWNKLLAHAGRWNGRAPSRLFPLTRGATA